LDRVFEIPAYQIIQSKHDVFRTCCLFKRRMRYSLSEMNGDETTLRIGEHVQILKTASIGVDIRTTAALSLLLRNTVTALHRYARPLPHAIVEHNCRV